MGVALCALIFASGLGGRLERLLQGTLTFIAEEKSLAPSIAFGLLVTAIFLIFYFWAVTSSVRSELKKICQFLRENAPDEHAFKKNYGRIHERLQNSKPIGHMWDEFAETLQPPVTDEDVYSNTIRPQAFFAFDELALTNTAFRHVSSLPGLFVGIGLLVTFVGIIAALVSANQALGGEGADTQAAVLNLLATASFKFWTSVAGLLCSLLLSYSLKTMRLGIEQDFASLSEALEDGLQFQTTQSINLGILDAARNTVTATEGLKQDLAMRLAEVIEKANTTLSEQLQKAFNQAISDLSNKVGELADKAGGDNAAQLEKIIASFVERIETQTRHQMDDVADKMGRASQTLATTLASFQESGSGFQTQITEAGQTLANVGKRLETVIDEAGGRLDQSIQQSANTFAIGFEDAAERGNQALSQTVGQLQGTQSSLEVAIDKLRETTEAQGTLAQAFTATTGQIQEAGRTLTQTLTSLNDAARDVRAASGESSEALQAASNRFSEAARDATRELSESQQRLSALSDTISQHHQALADAWDSYRERFEKVDQSLGGSIEHLRTQTSTILEQTQHFVQQFDRSYSDALQQLNSVVGELSETVSELGNGRLES